MDIRGTSVAFRADDSDTARMLEGRVRDKLRVKIPADNKAACLARSGGVLANSQVRMPKCFDKNIMSL
jgi:hypothetical protein